MSSKSQVNDVNIVKKVLNDSDSPPLDLIEQIPDGPESLNKDWGTADRPSEGLVLLMEQIDQKVKTANEKKDLPKVPYRKILLTYADIADKLYFFFGFLTAVSCGLGLPSFVFLFGDIADSFEKGEDPQQILDAITYLSKSLTFIGLAVWACSYMFFTFFIIASERIGQKTRIHYLKSILRQEIGWFDQVNTSELSSRLGKECQTIQIAIGEKIGNICMACAMSCSGIFFAFFKGWYFSLILLCYFPVLFAMTVLITIAFSKGFSENMKAYGQSAGYAEQALNAIKVVFAFGQEETEIRNYEKYLQRAKKTGIKTHLFGSLTIGGFFATLYGYYSYSFYTGSYMITDERENTISGKNYSSGDIMACFLGLVYGIFSLGLVAPNLKCLSEGRIAGKMAYEIIDRKPKIDLDDPEADKIEELKGQIEFKNVSFKYPTRPEQKILDNFSAVFEQGKTTAIVGASGSGKSTIVQLIERFYDPDEGTVFVDGKDLRKLNLRNFRQKIGYVGQEPVLFNMTIKENLLYGYPDATDDEIIQALKSANAWDFIQEKMVQNGIETNVGNAGGQLSGGQKQRLAIARAFIKKPKILLLDEATSALDKKNEKEVQAAIDKIKEALGGQITTIVIAHRLSTIRDADKIIVMQFGKIKETGTHETLVRDFPQGIYSKFVKEQEQAEDQGNLPGVEDTAQVQREESSFVQPVVPLVGKKGKVLQVDQREIDMKLKADQQDDEKDQADKQRLEILNKKSHFVRLLQYNRPRINILIGLLVSIFQGALMPVFGGVMAKMLFVLMEVLDLNNMRHDSNYWCGIMLIFSCCSFVAGFSQKFSFGVIGENVTLNIRRKLYAKIIEKHQGWFDERDNAPGVLTGTLQSDAQIINGASTEGLGAMVDALFAVLTGVGIGFYYSWRMALVCLGCTPFTVISGYMGAKFQQGLSVEAENSHKYANLLAGDAIMNYRTVASFAYEDQLVRDYRNLLEAPKKTAVKLAHKIGASYGFSQFVLYAVIATMFYAGAQFLDKFNEKPVDMFITIFAMMFGALESGQAQQFGPDMGKAKSAAKKIFSIIDQKTNVSALNKEGTILTKENFVGKIVFNDVWFRYPTRKNDWILKGLNLTINPNETIALVGESGCGKSTMVSLILRFYDPDFGTITVDGIDLKDYNLKSLREVMGLVMQEPTLFNYNITENILYGKLNASNTEIKEAATIANALDFIEQQNNNIIMFEDTAEGMMKELEKNARIIIEQQGLKFYKKRKADLEKLVNQEREKGKFVAIEGDVDQRPQDLRDIDLHPGFQIECGLKGNKLSGGQKQRIAIARAIIRKPKILILDEATSALDEESQKKVQVALDNIMKERTSIVIAHRLSTVEKCDRVIVLESGRVVEEGKFNELKQKEGGFFSQLASGLQGNNQSSPQKI